MSVLTAAKGFLACLKEQHQRHGTVAREDDEEGVVAIVGWAVKQHNTLARNSLSSFDCGVLRFELNNSVRRSFAGTSAVGKTSWGARELKPRQASVLDLWS